nr:copia protein [Tanacetum cinerariifolium]
MTIIGTKCVFRNKLDENGIVSRNKARLVARVYNQQEGIDYDETYRLELIRILLAYARALDFKLVQMDVKSAFPNGFINEDVYVAQPLGFIDFEKPNHVYKLKKDLYGLKQEPKSWPDIMFSVCLCAQFQEAPKTSHLEAVKRIFRYIKSTTHLRLWHPKGTGIETILYVDSDHARDYVDLKSTIGICTFVGCCLTSWFSKKQTALAISTTEAEYVSARKACQQALWMKQALIDYEVRLDDVPIMCDNKGTIDLSKNPMQHSRTKHIKIRHHFLRDNVQKGHISIEKVPSVNIITDILTKPIKRESFNYLQFAQILDIPCEGAFVFTDKWSLDELAYGVPTDGPYQTNPPSLDDIISSIQIDREGQVRRILHEEEIDVLEYQILTREIVPTLKTLEEIIREDFFSCLGVMNPLAAQIKQKTRKDHDTRRGRHSTSSSTFYQPSSSHLNDDDDDDDDDGNDEGTSRTSTPSLIRYVNSLTNEVSQVFQNPPNTNPYLEPFYTR